MIRSTAGQFYWTEERLNRLLQDISEFEAAAFDRACRTLSERKRAMQFAAQTCVDENIRSILGGSVNYVAKHPDWVRSAISRARGHVETLKYTPRKG